MAVPESAVTESPREVELIDAVSDKPNNGKLVAELSSFYLEAAFAAEDETRSATLRDHAVARARESIRKAPKKPFGHSALSCASRDHDERMASLRRAIDAAAAERDRFSLPAVGLMVRLLVETREEQSRRVKGKMGKASAQHPNRSALTSDEKALYEKIVAALQRAWAGTASNKDEFLTRREYRLGLFFRKRLPAKIYQPISRKHFLVCTEHAPNDFAPLAEFWLGTLGNEGDATTRLSKCPAEYIVGLYSTFAENFDELLVEKLHYKTPSKLERLLQSAIPKGVRFGRVADLGCGTGLSGEAFANVLSDGGSMDGIDLSPEMLDKARGRKSRGGKLYDRLVVGDVADLLVNETGDPEPYDLILACDVFVYLGDLNVVFQAASASLAANGDGGYFCFSTERLDPAAKVDYALQPCARFAHAKSYLERLAEEADFRIINIESSPIRKNQGKDVQGLLAILKK